MYLLDALQALLFGTPPPLLPSETQEHASSPVPSNEAPVTDLSANSGFVPPAGGGLLNMARDAIAASGLGDLAQAAVGVVGLMEDVLSEGLGAGDGRARVATVAGLPGALAMGAAQLTRNGLATLGVTDEKLIKAAEQTVAAGPFAPAVLLAHGVSAALRVVSPEADEALRNAIKPLDFTDPDQPAGAILQATSDAVKDIFRGPVTDVFEGEAAVQAQNMLAERMARMNAPKEAAPAPAATPVKVPLSMPVAIDDPTPASAKKTATVKGTPIVVRKFGRELELA